MGMSQTPVPPVAGYQHRECRCTHPWEYTDWHEWRHEIRCCQCGHRAKGQKRVKRGQTMGA